MQTTEERKARAAAYYAANKEKIKVKRAAYRAANPEKIKARNAAFCVANAVKIKVQKAGYYKDNKETMNAGGAAYYAANTEKVLARTAAYRAANPEKIKARGRARLYGLSPEGFQLMLLKQKNACGICKEPFLETTPYVDHCHETGEVRGLLCVRCNSGIGLLKDSPEILENAKQYLTNYNI